MIFKKFNKKIFFLFFFFFTCTIEKNLEDAFEKEIEESFFEEYSVPSQIFPVFNEDYFLELEKLIINSKNNIKILHFIFSYDEIASLLAGKVLSGVKDIQVLLEDSIKNNEKMVNDLEGFNINAKLDSPNKITHAKLIMVDEESLILGSTNLTFSSLFENNEANIMIKNKKLVEAFGKYFNNLWNESGKNFIIPHIEIDGVIPFGDTQYFNIAKELINSAKNEIFLVIYVINYNNENKNSPPTVLVDSLCEKANKGISVEVILEQDNYNEKLNELNKETADILENAKVQVRFDTIKKITHAKVLIVDDSVIVSSNNWGWNALTESHEIGVLIKDKNIASEFKKFFKEIWDNGIDH